MRKINKAIRNKAQISSGKKAKDKYKIDDIPSCDSAFSFGTFIKRTWETAPQILVGTVSVFMTIAFCVFVSENTICSYLAFIFPILVFFINYHITKNGNGSFMFSCIICLPLLIKSLSLFHENLRSSIKENDCYITTGRLTQKKYGSKGSCYFETSYKDWNGNTAIEKHMGVSRAAYDSCEIGDSILIFNYEGFVGLVMKHPSDFLKSKYRNGLFGCGKQLDSLEIAEDDSLMRYLQYVGVNSAA